MPHYEFQPRHPGGLQLASTWQPRLTELIQALLGFIVATVLLPVPVFGGIRLGRSLALGQDYDAGVFVASAVTVISAALVGIAVYFAVTRLVRAIRPLQPIYDEPATGAPIPPRDSISFQEAQARVRGDVDLTPTSFRDEARQARQADS